MNICDTWPNPVNGDFGLDGMCVTGGRISLHGWRLDFMAAWPVIIGSIDAPDFIPRGGHAWLWPADWPIAYVVRGRDTAPAYMLAAGSWKRPNVKVTGAPAHGD